MACRHVVVINDASVARGGATGLAVLSARLLVERGLRVTYICGDAGDAPDLAALGVTVRALGSAKLLNRGKLAAATAGLYNGQARDFVADAVRELDAPDVAWHVHGWAQILSPAVFSALRPVASRTVLHAHDFFLACPNGVYMDYQKGQACARVPLGASCLATQCDKRSSAQKYWRAARTALLRRTLDRRQPWAAIVLIHPDMAAGLKRAGYPESMLETVRNPVTPFCETRICAEDNARIAYVGRLEADKGVAELAEACRRLDLPLIMIGDGPMRAPLASAYPETAFPGWKTRAEIGALVQNARALAMVTHHPEPFGLVAAEASQSGLPVLLSETALLAPEMVGGGIGFATSLFPDARFEAALAEIREMPRAQIAEMSRRAFAREVPLAQSPEAWAAQLHGLYDRACATG